MAIENETIGTAMIVIADKVGIAVTEMFKIYTGVQAGFAMVDVASTLIPLFAAIALIFLIYRAFREREITKTLKAKTRKQMKIEKKLKQEGDDGAQARYEALDEEDDRLIDKEDELENKIIIYGILAFLVPLILCIIINVIGIAILKIYYPEYFAIQTMLTQFGGMV